MNTFKSVCLTILIIFCFSFNSLSINKPTGLMTDLMEHTDRVYINGYVSNLTIGDIDKAVEPVQFVEILSTHPSFSWIVPGTGQGIMQNAYHIMVSDNQQDLLIDKGNIWDSNKVQSNRSVAVQYNGTALLPLKTYYWKVKVYTNKEEKSEWSDIKAFRTGEKLQAYANPHYPLVKTRENPKSISPVNTSTRFIDFGKASFAQLELTLTSKKDNDTIWVHLGERKDGNRINRNPGGTIRYQCHLLPLLKGTHTYKVKIMPDKRNTGNAAVMMPDYIGEVLPFRYCEIENYVPELKQTDITRESVHYPFDETASYFHSDNDILNQVWEMCKYSIKATSFTGIYIDGDRERIPYEADALINQLCHYGVDREYTMARRSHEYLLAHPTWPTEWIMQSILIAWYDYMYTGDSRSLAANYELLKNRSLMQLRDETGFITTTTGKLTPEFLASIRFNGQIRDIVDWPHTGILGLGKNEGGEADGFVFTDYNAVTNAYHYESIRLLAGIAEVLGKKEEAVSFRKDAEQFKKKYNHTFFNKKHKRYQDGRDTEHASLHSNMFAVAFDLPTADNQPAILDYMQSRKMACSVYGSQFLMDAIYKANDQAYALSLLTATHDRSWYNMIKAGSTISMEAWDDKYKPNQDWNHAWGAVPANIIPRRLVGITPLTPGFETIQIKPQVGSLKEVESIIPTIRGSIHICIKNSNEDGTLYSLQVTIPANMSAEVYLPYLSKNNKYSLNDNNIQVKKLSGQPFINAGIITSGTYTFEIK